MEVEPIERNGLERTLCERAKGAEEEDAARAEAAAADEEAA